MSATGPHSDYHSLLSLHHSMLLRRRLRGGRRVVDTPTYAARLLADWPERESDQRLLRESLAVLEPLEETLTHLYTVLFRDGPHLRNLFPESLAAQRHRLTQAVTYLIDGLGEPDLLVPVFAQLGRAHRKLGVRTTHYQPFGRALIEALHHCAGPAWRDEYDQAWLRAYQFIAGIMGNAAETAVAEPPYLLARVVQHELRRPDLAILRVRTDGPYPYQAGQYATIESPDLPHTWRCYSMAGPPGADGTLEFHVRATGAGRLSDVLVHKVAVGDQLRISPARGTMTLAPASPRDVLLVAGGTGLAPIRALLGELAGQPNPPATWLFFGARTRYDLYDLEALTWSTQRHSWLRLVPVVTEGDAYPYQQGTVVDAVCASGEWTGHDAYLSGPAEMVDQLRDRLVGLGVEPDHIRYDPQ